jgi:hypothetical protein
MATIDSLERRAVVLRGQRLEYFTIAWNTLEGLAAVIAGAVAGSISLVGFGIDSFIEATSGSVLLWWMSVDSDVHLRKINEKRALRFVGTCFLLLAVYIAYDSILDLRSKRAPEHSIPGIVLACVLVDGDAFAFQSKTKSGPCDGKRRHARGRETNRILHLSVGHSAGRPAAERFLRLVVG